MPRLKARNRVVYFRISEPEYERLTALCRSVDGERNISELARLAVRQMIGGERAGPWPGDGLESEIREMKLKVDAILRHLAPGADGPDSAHG